MRVVLAGRERSYPRHGAEDQYLRIATHDGRETADTRRFEAIVMCDLASVADAGCRA